MGDKEATLPKEGSLCSQQLPVICLTTFQVPNQVVLPGKKILTSNIL